MFRLGWHPAPMHNVRVGLCEPIISLWRFPVVKYLFLLTVLPAVAWAQNTPDLQAKLTALEAPRGPPKARATTPGCWSARRWC